MINCINCKFNLKLDNFGYYWCNNINCKIKCIWFWEPKDNYSNQYTYYVDNYRVLISNSKYYLADNLLIADGIYLSQDKTIRSKNFISLDIVDKIIKNSMFL